MNTKNLYIAMDGPYFVVYCGEDELKRFLSQKRAFEYLNNLKDE